MTTLTASDAPGRREVNLARAQYRLATWADHYLLPGVLVVLLLGDVGIGLVWLLTPASSFTSPAYDAAKSLMPMSSYGAAMVVGAVIASVGFWVSGRAWITGWVAGPLMGGQWIFWFWLFTLGVMGRPGATFTGSVFASVAALLHLLAGLAVSTVHHGRRWSDPRTLSPMPTPRRHRRPSR